MRTKIFKFWLIIVLIVASLTPIIEATFITIYPADSEDDAFITGGGNYFGDTPFLPLRGSTDSYVLGTRFRNVTIPQGSKINNATLRVKSVYAYPSATNITVTITGDDTDDSLGFNDSGSFSRVYTLAYEVWNISNVNGNIWAEVDVTAIVQEIIDRPGWSSGNSLSLIYFTDKGTPRRELATLDNNAGYRCRVNIFHSVEPSPDTPQGGADPPFNDTDYTWIYDDTYRGIDIWNVTLTNRTALEDAADVVNWAKVNLTQLTEIDTGAALTLNNDTWITVSELQAQQTDVFYNDTGSNNIRHFFSRCAINISQLTNTQIGNDPLFTVTGISTATPAGGIGLAYGGTGQWAGILCQINPDDVRYRFMLAERTNLNHLFYDISGWFNDIDDTLLYFEFRVTIVHGVGGVFSYGIWADPEYQNLIFWGDASMAYAINNFRYPQMIASIGTGTSRLNDAEYYSLLYDVDIGLVQFISYPNGTLVDPDPLPEDSDPEDVIDDLLGGAQPEDPETDKYGSIGKFRWKLLVMAVGFIMLLGSPIAGIHYGAGTASWIKILFIMSFGLAILSSLKFM